MPIHYFSKLLLVLTGFALAGCSTASTADVASGEANSDTTQALEEPDVSSSSESDGGSDTIQEQADMSVGSGCKNPEECVAGGDGNPCIAWTCASGECATIPVVDGTPCDDLNACTEISSCVGTVCVSEEEAPCEDANPCTKDTCKPEEGCVWEPVNLTCDDSNPCTSADTCKFGLCEGVPLDCDDGNLCTDDSCGVDDGCVHVSNEVPCDDDNVCTLNDLCGNDVCSGPDTLDCEDEQICSTDLCDAQLGCVSEANALPCDDGDACSANDLCADFVCAGTPLDCDDGFPCTFDACSETGVCENVPQEGVCTVIAEECQDVSCVVGEGCVYTSDDSKCDDGVSCTADACFWEGCGFTPNDIACVQDGTECFDYICDATVGCLAVAAVSYCEDGVECTVDTCDGATGLCGHEPQDEICVDLSTQCFVYHCDGVAGCQTTADETLCDDGIGCSEDACQLDGNCSHLPSVSYCEDFTKDCLVVEECSLSEDCVFSYDVGLCDDDVPCTTETCVLSGDCLLDPVDEACDDENGCTTDSCTAEGCVFIPNSLPCDDDDGCLGDVCAEGICVTQFAPMCTGECMHVGVVEVSAGNGLCEEEFNCSEWDLDGPDCTNCESGEMKDCVGICRTGEYLEGNITDDNCKANLDCARFEFDRGACVCEPGYLKDCLGNCYSANQVLPALGNGTCDIPDSVTETGGPVLGCGKFDFDQGDCIGDGTPSYGEDEVESCSGDPVSVLDVIDALATTPLACFAVLDCGTFDYSQAECFAECELLSGVLESCENNTMPSECLSLSYYVYKEGNGVCDDKLNCAKFGWDQGDCL